MSFMKYRLDIVRGGKYKRERTKQTITRERETAKEKAFY